MDARDSHRHALRLTDGNIGSLLRVVGFGAGAYRPLHMAEQAACCSTRPRGLEAEDNEAGGCRAAHYLRGDLSMNWSLRTLALLCTATGVSSHGGFAAAQNTEEPENTAARKGHAPIHHCGRPH